MITLFFIVIVASLTLAASRAEGMRPLGLALVGMTSMVLGVQATAVFTDSAIAPLLTSVASAQETPATAAESPENAEDKAEDVSAAAEATDSDAASRSAADETPAAESPGLTSAAEEGTGSETAAEPDEVTADGGDVEDATDASAPVGSPPEPAAPAAEEPADTVEDAVEDERPADASSAAPRQLSSPTTVEKITNVTYVDREGEDTPEWLEKKPWTQDGVHFVPVTSRIQITEADCATALDSEVEAATAKYVNRLLKNKLATTLLDLNSSAAAPKVMGSFDEEVVLTAGTMYQSHVLLSFDKDFHEAIQAEWNEVRVTSRLMQTGLGAAVVLLLLGTMFSYFRLDTATRGYYTGRLQFAAAAAILTVIAVGVLFANYVPWM